MENGKTRRRRFASAGIGIWLATATTAAPLPAHRPVRGGAPRSHAFVAGIAPADYRRALAPVTTCADFFGHVATLPQARPLLRSLFVGGIPERPPGETADAFIGRMLHRLFVRLGDPTKIYTETPLDGAARYDPTTQMMTIDLGQPPVLGVLEQRTSLSRLPGRGITRVQTELQAAFDFAPATLPPPLSIRMDPEEAARFKAGGGRLRALSLFEDYGTDSHAATAASVPTRYDIVRLKPHCAVLVNRGQPFSDWRLDAWTPEPPSGG